MSPDTTRAVLVGMTIFGLLGAAVLCLYIIIVWPFEVMHDEQEAHLQELESGKVPGYGRE